MTWPVSYNDVPSKADFPNPETVKVDDVLGMFMGKGIGSKGNVKNVDYTEYNDGVYVGYRYYQTKNVPVSFPFGYGMSYTTFKYGKPVVTKDAQGNIKVLVTVKNAGKVAGKEVVQVYVAAPGKDMDKPAKELRGSPRLRNCSLVSRRQLLSTSHTRTWLLSMRLIVSGRLRLVITR